RARDLFPLGFRPLSHPLQTVGHQLFPQTWVKNHPEHDRFDVDFDIPEPYLPEFPPPLFLTTRPDLGDVSRGYAINQANFHELFDGVITPGQMECLRLLVTKFPTSWFNQRKHRVTKQPTRASTNRMADFNPTIAWPPAAKLDRLGKLIPAKATDAELRGEKLFHGKAKCASCHPAPFYTDNLMHDLRVEEFYPGRAQGWIK